MSDIQVQIFGTKKNADTRKAQRFFAERRVASRDCRFVAGSACQQILEPIHDVVATVVGRLMTAPAAALQDRPDVFLVTNGRIGFRSG